MTAKIRGMYWMGILKATIPHKVYSILLQKHQRRK